MGSRQRAVLLSFGLLALTTTALARPVVIAHRGASGYLPEHTLPAAAAAHAMGADYIEPDVVLSKDGVPVVLHDIHLETTTDVAKVFPDRKRADGRWYAIDFTLGELKRLAVHERAESNGKAAFPDRFPLTSAIFQIPTLEEMILLVQGMNKSTGRDAGLYPELKYPAFHTQEGQDIARVVLDLLAKHGYSKRADKVIVQCFDPAALKRVRTELKSDLKLVQLIGDNSWGEADTDYTKMLTESGLKEIAAYADGIGPWMPQVLSHDPKTGRTTPTSLVRLAHAAKLQVHPYTARADQLQSGMKSFDELLAAVFGAAKADGVFTDHPDRALAYIAAGAKAAAKPKK